MSVPLASCATAPKQTLIDAATTAAEAAATQSVIDIGPQPGECLVPEPHASLVIGRDAVVILKQERARKDAETDSKARCAKWYENLRAALLNKENT